MDIESVRRWWDYTAAYRRMIEATHTPEAPWHIVPADDKRRARLNLIRHLLDSIPYEKVDIQSGRGNCADPARQFVEHSGWRRSLKRGCGNALDHSVIFRAASRHRTREHGTCLGSLADLSFTSHTPKAALPADTTAKA
jgi:hypothetical protein